MTTALPPGGLNRFAAVAPVAAVAVGLAIALPPFLSFVVASGANVPARDLASDYAIGVVWALLLGASILIWPVSRSDRRALLLSPSVGLASARQAKGGFKRGQPDAAGSSVGHLGARVWIGLRAVILSVLPDSNSPNGDPNAPLI